MYMKVTNYKEMEVWKKGIEIVNLVYGITLNFPKTEMFGLSSQMNRSAVSIPSNVAEGFVRQYTKEYIQFAYVSLGSCAELDTQLIIAKNRGYVSESEFERLENIICEESKMLNGLIRSLSHH
jgi:four helix bundle protein